MHIRDFILILFLLELSLALVSKTKLKLEKKEMDTNRISTSDLLLNGFLTLESDGKPIDSWSSLEGKFPQELACIVKIDNNHEFRINLEQNRDLLTSDYKELSLNDFNATNNLNNFCYYRGVVSGETNSYAAVNICKGKIEGTFHVEEQRFFMESTNDSSAIVFQEYENEEANLTYAYRNSKFKLNSNLKTTKFSQQKRAINLPWYYSEYVQWNQLYVEFAIVFDYSMYIKYDEDVDVLNSYAKKLTNLMNAFYQQLNIKIALVGVEVWTEGDRITVSNNVDTTLDQFHRYRQWMLLNVRRNDNAQLITDVPFNGGMVGKALKEKMCSEMSDAIVNDHSSKEIVVAALMAHLMGHNFGMEHDNEFCECPENSCIMVAPSRGINAPFYWSTCSLEYLSRSLTRGGDFCLKNTPSQFFSSSTCGNGITEAGEDCDCKACTNKCCNTMTCKFNTGAICATGECCDENTCTVKPMATVCRSTTNDCDLKEYCNGKSEICPSDTYKHNGIACNSNSPFFMCVNRKCVDRNDVVVDVITKNNCVKNCHNGVCNNLGNCHCDAGYGGADCSISESGGSIDSGPVSAERLGVLILISIVIPIIIAVIILFVVLKRKGKKIDFNAFRAFLNKNLNRKIENQGSEKRNSKEPQCTVEGPANLNGARGTETQTISEIDETCNEKSPFLLQTTNPSISAAVVAEIHNMQSCLTANDSFILPDYLNIPKEISCENVIFGKLIGDGNFGKVLKGTLQSSNDSIEVALKAQKTILNTQEIICLQLELRILLLLGPHINVVRLIGAVTKPCMYGNLVLVSEFCQFGDLRTYITKRKCKIKENARSFGRRPTSSYDRFTLLLDSSVQNVNFGKSLGNELNLILKKDALCLSALFMYALQIANGAHFLSRRNIIHRDLALRNIFLNSDHIVKIGDFGLAVNDVEYEVKSPKPLPIRWLAPESLSGIFTTKSDIFTFGIVLWELFSLADSPMGINKSYNTEKFHQWLLDENKLDRPKYAPDLIYQLMLQTWKIEPNLRPSFEHCRTAIKNILIASSPAVFAYVAEKISLELQSTLVNVPSANIPLRLISPSQSNPTRIQHVLNTL